MPAKYVFVVGETASCDARNGKLTSNGLYNTNVVGFAAFGRSYMNFLGSFGSLQ